MIQLTYCRTARSAARNSSRLFSSLQDLDSCRDLWSDPAGTTVRDPGIGDQLIGQPSATVICQRRKLALLFLAALRAVRAVG